MFTLTSEGEISDAFLIRPYYFTIVGFAILGRVLSMTNAFLLQKVGKEGILQKTDENPN